MADTYSNLQIKVRGMVNHAYQLHDKFSDSVYTETQAGKTLNVPVFQAEEAINVADGGGAYSDAANTIPAVDVDLDDPVKWRKKVPLSQEEDVPDLSFNKVYADMGGMAVARGVGLRLINRAAGTVGVEVVEADFTDPATLPAVMAEVGRQCAALLGTQGLSEELYGYLHPDVAYGWWTPLGYFHRPDGGQGALADSAIAKRWPIFGINWLATALGFKADYSANTNLAAAYRVDNTLLVGAVWHKFAVALRRLTPNPVTKVREAPEDDYVWVRCRQRIGTKAVQTGGIILIKQTAP